jgi:hypothetical protein
MTSERAMSTPTTSRDKKIVITAPSVVEKFFLELLNASRMK